MTHSGAWHLALAALLSCGGSKAEAPVVADSAARALPLDSLVLTGAAGIEIWYRLARTSTAVDGQACVERGLEIRQGGRRVQVPLLYTGSPPVLVNDSTMKAILWTHCAPGQSYLVDLRSGHPVRERSGAAP
ncbi:MAG TPA: hypothetical protein VIG04_06470 [Gemmatimonadales bacterium]